MPWEATAATTTPRAQQLLQSRVLATKADERVQNIVTKVGSEAGSPRATGVVARQWQSYAKVVAKRSFVAGQKSRDVVADAREAEVMEVARSHHTREIAALQEVDEAGMDRQHYTARIALARYVRRLAGRTFGRWCLVIRASVRRRVTIVRALHKLAGRRTVSAFSSWLAFSQRQITSRRRLANVLQRRELDHRAIILHGWVVHTVTKRWHRHIIAKLLSQARAFGAASSFELWLGVTRDHSRSLRLDHRARRHFVATTQAKTLMTLATRTRLQKHCRSALLRMLSRRRARQLEEMVDRWATHVATSRFFKTAVSRALRSAEDWRVHVSFSGWQAAAATWVRERQLLGRGLRTLRRTAQRATFWRWAAQCSLQARLRHCGRRLLARWLRRILAAMFQTWQQNSSKIQADRCRLQKTLGRIESLMCLTAVRSWQAAANGRFQRRLLLTRAARRRLLGRLCHYFGWMVEWAAERRGFKHRLLRRLQRRGGIVLRDGFEHWAEGVAATAHARQRGNWLARSAQQRNIERRKRVAFSALDSLCRAVTRQRRELGSAFASWLGWLRAARPVGGAQESPLETEPRQDTPLTPHRDQSADARRVWSDASSAESCSDDSADAPTASLGDESTRASTSTQSVSTDETASAGRRDVYGEHQEHVPSPELAKRVEEWLTQAESESSDALGLQLQDDQDAVGHAVSDDARNSSQMDESTVSAGSVVSDDPKGQLNELPAKPSLLVEAAAAPPAQPAQPEAPVGPPASSNRKAQGRKIPAGLAVCCASPRGQPKR